MGAIGLIIAGLLLLTGCSAPSADEAGERSPSVSATPSPTRPTLAYDVPIQSGSLDTLGEPVIAPVSLSLAALGIEMAVQPEGLDADKQMALPVSPYVAGWYKFGPGPHSEQGATVIAAHVDSLAEGIGPFARLKDTPIGAEVSVTDADGATHLYRVVTVERIAKSDVPLDRVFTREGAPTIVLVTCGGEWNAAADSYKDNYIVTAEKVS